MPVESIDNVPVLPGGTGESDRRNQQRKRRAVLEGTWKTALDERIRQFFPATTHELFGLRDLSKNLMGRVSTELSVLYSRPPKVENADATDEQVSEFDETVTAAGLWQLAQDNQRLAFGARESFLRVDVVEGSDRVVRPKYRLVPADVTFASAPPDEPDRPNLVVEGRMRNVVYKQKRADVWTLDVLDVRDPANPQYRVLVSQQADSIDELLARPELDVTDQVVKDAGGLALESYPYIVDDRPVVPYSLYHARRTGKLWDPYRLEELYQSTLQVAAYWTFYGFLIRDCSTPVRALADGEFVGGATAGSQKGNRHEMAFNPATMLKVISDGNQKATALSWQAGADPERFQLAISEYEKAALIDAGLSVDDTTRTGGPESGWARAIARESVRQKQAEMALPFGQADAELLNLTAALLNRFAGTSYPETGWGVTYRGVPLSLPEIQARLQEGRERIEAGVWSKVDMIMADHPDWSREQAIEFLTKVQDEVRRFGGADAAV